MNNRIKSLALLVNLGIYGVAFPLSAAETATDDKNSAAEETMVVTAAEQNLQAPGVSTITADEIRKRPPARDVSEIIRTMPGVNLTGNSTSGQRGNNRQIAIRGMGPENTLILIDEFGTGTEPMLGGAIAEAILKTLNQKQVKGVITTHYTNLKHFAAETTGIENGAMLYDSHRMLPLFELCIGKPGSSFDFEIAKKIVLPKEILEDADSKIGEDHINYDKHLKDIARDKRYWEEKRRRIHENEKRLDEVVEKYRQELTEAYRLRKEIIKEAQQKAQEIIHSANKTIEQTIRDIRENQAEKEKTKEIRQKMEAEKERLLSEQASAEEERIRKKMEKLQNREKNKKTKNKASASTPASEGTTTELPLQKGDFVSLPNKAIGEILEINDKTAVIALGNLSTTAKLSQLKRASASQAKKVARTQPQASYANIRENISQKRFDFKPDIDLRGMRGEEALQKVITFLDEAVMLNYKEVRLLHGTGTGALRQLIRQYLSTNPLVASFGDEQIQLGGAGITVVKLDI